MAACWTNFEVVVQDTDYREISANGESAGVRTMDLEVGAVPSCSCRLVLKGRLILDFAITKKWMTCRLLELVDALET
jgi:hypothetical protein